VSLVDRILGPEEEEEPVKHRFPLLFSVVSTEGGFIIRRLSWGKWYPVSWPEFRYRSYKDSIAAMGKLNSGYLPEELWPHSVRTYS
jgi:hypothetical protein